MENPEYIFKQIASDDYRLRIMTETDLPEVLAIEWRSYEFPWSEEIFKDCLRVGYHCKVIEYAGVIVGYAAMTAGAGEAHIVNLCIKPEFRKQGLGTLLLAHIMDEARSLGVDNMLLEVRPSNIGAIKLYMNMGFNEIGMRKGYYPARHGREDALILACAL
jgi:ribosomal-protein-alanine N-acetyltransferase